MYHGNLAGIYRGKRWDHGLGEHLVIFLEHEMGGLQELWAILYSSSHLPREAITDVPHCLPGSMRCGTICPTPLRTGQQIIKPNPPSCRLELPPQQQGILQLVCNYPVPLVWVPSFLMCETKMIGNWHFWLMPLFADCISDKVSESKVVRWAFSILSIRPWLCLVPYVWVWHAVNTQPDCMFPMWVWFQEKHQKLMVYLAML